MFVLKEIVVEPINCEWCKAKIPRPTRSQKYCNEKCRNNARIRVDQRIRDQREKIVYHPICPQCHKSITTYDKKRVYCDDECKRLFGIQKNRLKRREITFAKIEGHQIDPMFLSRNG